MPDNTKTIRERAIAAWPPAWQGKNLSRILVSLGYNIDVPWQSLPQETRDWILFTDETPTVPVYPEYSLEQVRVAIENDEKPHYMGTFSSAKRFILHSLPRPKAH